MNRPLLFVAFFAAASAALVAQQGSQSSPYQGVSNPPPDDSITYSDTSEAPAKPPAGHPLNAQPAVPAQRHQAPVYAAANPTNRITNEGTDDGVVQGGSPSGSAEPNLRQRSYASDPDGDIVHPEPLGPGVLGEGTMIRVRLMNHLSSSFTEQGQPFRSRVATDVLQDSNVVIPAGSEISGTVVDVSSGHLGGHGSLMLRPEKVTLPNGESFQLHAMVKATPGSHTRVGEEGVIRPDSRKKRDSIEYGAVVGGGAIAGAFIGGPAGALAGGIIGAGVVTTHLLISHPQANLNSGSVLMLTLTEQVHLVPSSTQGN
jgi:hypothetical protein